MATTQKIKRPYKVRKAFNDTKSQIAAYAVLENAIEKAEQNPGYSVYDEHGKKVWSAPKEESKQIKKAEAITAEAEKVQKEELKSITVTQTSEPEITAELVFVPVKKQSFIKRVFNKILRRGN